jgi:hypothetical protein
LIKAQAAGATPTAFNTSPAITAIMSCLENEPEPVLWREEMKHFFAKHAKRPGCRLRQQDWRCSNERGASADTADTYAIPSAYEQVAELLVERGVEVDPSCIWRWVQAYAPNFAMKP